MSEKHLPNLTSLEELDAPSNLQLTLQVSSNWTPFHLRRLDLGSFLLGPQFPAWLQTQKHLDFLYMPNAEISGVIPAWFWTRSYATIDCCFLINKAIPHRLDVGFSPSFSPIKGESPSSLDHTSPLHLRLFVVLPNCFGYLLFASIS